MRPLSFPVSPLLLLLLTGCDKSICELGTAWVAGDVAFQNVTDAWGLDALNPEGTRINAVDFDGDGWPDLVVRRGNDPDDFSADGIRNSWFLRNTGDGSFEDVTQSSGIRQNRYSSDPDVGHPGQIVVWGDVDNDGDLDAFIGVYDTDGSYDEVSEIMLGDGAGGFSLVPGDSDDLHYSGSTSIHGGTFVDYDLDGALDLWGPEYEYDQDRLYRGSGSGSFSEVTYDVGINTRGWSDVDDLNAGLSHTVAWSSVACDLNNDGLPELLAASYGRAPNHLWQAVGDGTYKNRSVASGYAYDDRVDWSDNGSAMCWCYLHPDDEDCEGMPDPIWTCNSDDDAFRWDHDTDRELYRLGGNSGTTVCADVDNDGFLDLLTTEIVHWDVGSSSDPSELLFNTGAADVEFERPGNEATGLTREHELSSWNDGDMTGTIFDFDNDGWADVYIGSSDYEGARGLLYHNLGGRLFEAVPVEQGIDHTRSHGVAVADFDRDGDLDLVAGHSSSRCEDDCYDTFNVRMFENVVGEDNGTRGNFIQLSLEGSGDTNRSAIGARVQVITDATTQTQEVGGGYGHVALQNDLLLHFGLGQACEAEITIRWPDAALSTESHLLDGGHRYHIRQGDEPEIMDLEE